MNKYEIMYILLANLDEESRKHTITKLHNILTDHGAEVTKVEEWGIRDFAYPVKDEVKGYYVVIKVSADPAATAEFDRLAKLDTNVLRHIVVVDQD